MTFLVIVHICICIFLICVILLQAGKADGGVGFGSSSQSIFGSKGAGNFLTKTTSVFAIIFLGTSFYLTRSRLKEYEGSVIKGDVPEAQSGKVPEKKEAAVEPKKEVPEKPEKPEKPK